MTSYLGGTLRQRRTGLGWRGVSDLPHPADSPSAEVLEVHERFDRIAALAGSGLPGGPGGRGRASCSAGPPRTSRRWLRGVVTGDVRQGALDALVQEAVAAAAGVPLAVGTPRRDAGRLDTGGRRWPR